MPTTYTVAVRTSQRGTFLPSDPASQWQLMPLAAALQRDYHAEGLDAFFYPVPFVPLNGIMTDAGAVGSLALSCVLVGDFDNKANRDGHRPHGSLDSYRAAVLAAAAALPSEFAICASYATPNGVRLLWVLSEALPAADRAAANAELLKLSGLAELPGCDTCVSKKSQGFYLPAIAKTIKTPSGLEVLDIPHTAAALNITGTVCGFKFSPKPGILAPPPRPQVAAAPPSLRDEGTTRSELDHLSALAFDRLKTAIAAPCLYSCPSYRKADGTEESGNLLIHRIAGDVFTAFLSADEEAEIIPALEDRLSDFDKERHSPGRDSVREFNRALRNIEADPCRRAARNREITRIQNDKWITNMIRGATA